MDSAHLVDDQQLASSPPLRAMVAATLLGFAALVAAGRGIAVLLQPVARSGTDAKLAAYLEGADELDTLILGSSLVARGVDPGAFDRTMAEHGFATRSFNLGVPGMYALEQEHVLERILARKPERLRYVLVAPDLFALRMPDELLRNRRTAHWHDLPATVLATRGLLAADLPWRVRFVDVYRHWQAWFFRLVAVGEIRARLEARARPEILEDHATELLGEDGRGFVPLDALVQRVPEERAAEALRNREQLLERADRFRERLAESEGRVPRPLRAFEIDYLRRVQALLEEAGVTPVFFALPGNGVEFPDWLREAHAEGIVDRFVDLSPPAAYPELYALEHRFDQFHVNTPGAALLTRALAEGVAEVLEEEAGR